MAAAAKLPPLLLLLLAAAAALPAPSYGWGVDGHLMVCQIAQGRLSDAAAAAVKDLLPSYAGNNLNSLCSWADDVKFRYHWSSPLHYIDTPDGLCTYSYDRDCKDEDGVKGRCVAGAINNYTSQLLTYGRSSAPQYNLTQALLFLSHFMGDIHQPLHVGFTSDRGGNTIDVHWYTRKTVLHHVRLLFILTKHCCIYDSEETLAGICFLRHSVRFGMPISSRRPRTISTAMV
ncbi:hypothetical protein HU200_001988 [Digitaria exilis]|uniref:Aspergillus nuclease S1 n=1 Tax=Digitaria exilis TaxID=1010633 RepID=A0A835KX59_9POAL|nr:hypothetical protein HU200_001988 [Digitaria exilis]